MYVGSLLAQTTASLLLTVSQYAVETRNVILPSVALSSRDAGDRRHI